jgi:hypothetical protein
MVPINPMIKPRSCSFFQAVLKHTIPITKAKMGVNPLRTPAIELARLVSAVANKKAGIRLPRKPVMTTYPNLFLGILDKEGMAQGSSTKKENTTLRAPTCPGS